MKVAFGISFGSSTPLLRREDTRKFMDLVKMADDYGAEAIGTFDTAFIGGDAYVRATLIAQASARARVGLRPTNPLTREPQVMASFLASIDHLTDGRAFMDMARPPIRGARSECAGRRAPSARACPSRFAPRARGCSTWAAGSATASSPAPASYPRGSRTRSCVCTPARARPAAGRRTSGSGSPRAGRYTRTATRRPHTARRRDR